MEDSHFESRNEQWKGFFIVSRTPGLIAHAYEQLYYDKPYKVAGWDEVAYTGPAERTVPDR